jgi:hypothetical protein
MGRWCVDVTARHGIGLCVNAVLETLNEATEKIFGYPLYGYWPWHNTEQAVEDCDKHVSVNTPMSCKLDTQSF